LKIEIDFDNDLKTHYYIIDEKTKKSIRVTITDLEIRYKGCYDMFVDKYQ
jgi:hypothetical protein